MELFTINHLNFAYPEQEKQAISDLTLSVRPGSFWCSAAPPGAAKVRCCGSSKPFSRRMAADAAKSCSMEEISIALDQREQAEKLGFVQQSPENQIATDKVWHELAFGLESLGYDTPTIRRRVAEMAIVFRNSGMVLQIRHGAVRWAKAALESRIRYGACSRKC